MATEHGVGASFYKVGTAGVGLRLFRPNNTDKSLPRPEEKLPRTAHYRAVSVLGLRTSVLPLPPASIGKASAKKSSSGCLLLVSFMRITAPSQLLSRNRPASSASISPPILPSF